MEEIIGNEELSFDEPETQSNKEHTVLDKIKEELEEYKDLYLRASADYQNLKKRTEKEFVNGWYNGQDKMIEEFLPFFDNFERMIENELDYKGASFVHDSLQSIFRTNNISVINPQPGDVFDETFHNAIMTDYTDSVKLDNHIKMTLAKGYKHNDHVIRYAAVCVYKYNGEQ